MIKTKKLVRKQTENFARIDQELTDIYRNSDGSMPNMKNFEAKKRSRFVSAFVFLLFSCVILAGVVWAGFFFFEPKSGFREQDIILTVLGDGSVTPGGNMTFRVKYRNDQPIGLNKVVLELRYPEGFVFGTSSIPVGNDKKDSWDLGVVAAGEGGSIEISGRYYGSFGEKQSVRAFLNYEPANFNSQFQKVANLNVVGDKPCLDLQVVLPEKSPVGSEVGVGVSVVRLPEFVEKLDGLKIFVDNTSGFSVKSAKPIADKNSQNIWTIGDLTTTTKLDLRGVFANSGEESAMVKFSIIGRYGERGEGEYVLTEKTVTTTLTKTSVDLSLAANGSAGLLTLKPGDDFNVALVLNNSGSADITNARIRFVLDAPSVNSKSIMAWSRIEDTHDGTIDGEQLSDTLRRGILTWTAKEEKKLAKIKPGERVEIDFNLPVKNSKDMDLATFLTASGTASVEVQFDEAGENKIVSGNKIEIKYNSDLKFSTQDEIGADGLTHGISWVLENSFHDLVDISLEADLYGNIEFDETALVVPAGEVKFDAEKKKLTWKIPSLPIAVDTSALQFRVKILKANPSQTNLTSKVKLIARDVISGENILLSGDEVLLKVVGE